MDHVAVIIVMAVAAMGVWIAMGQGMILGWFSRLVERYLPVVLSKPLATCFACMVTLYGTTAAVLVGVMPGDIVCALAHPSLTVEMAQALAQLIAYIACAVGLQEMITR